MLAHELSPAAVFSILVNTCMGIGFLAIPYSTLRFGLMGAVTITLGLGALAVCTGLWVATTLSLTWALTRTKQDPEISAQTPLSASEDKTDTCDHGNFEIGTSFQMSFVKLIGVLYGDACQKCATSVLTLVLVIALWSFAAIFAGSMAAIVPAPLIGGTCDVYGEWTDPTCASRYYLYLAIFAVLMVLLTLVRLREQQSFQLAMTVCRIVLGVAIVGDCIRMLSLGEAPPHPGHGADESAHVVGSTSGSIYRSDRFPSSPSPWNVNLDRGPQHIALVTAALTVHMVIPDAVHDLADKKRNLLPTIGAALAFCAVVYCLLSGAVVLTYGAWTRPVCTLNWVNYTAGQPVAGPFAIAFRSFVILVPVLDVTAAYPILAQSLAANLDAAIHSETGDRPAWYLALSCAVGPLIGAALVYDAAETLGWCGVLLVPFVFILPQLLLLRAEHLCLKEFSDDQVHTSTYWCWHCDRRLVLASLFIGILLCALSFVSVFSSLF